MPTDKIESVLAVPDDFYDLQVSDVIRIGNSKNIKDSSLRSAWLGQENDAKLFSFPQGFQHSLSLIIITGDFFGVFSGTHHIYPLILPSGTVYDISDKYF